MLCGMHDPSSLTRDATRIHWKHGVSTMGPPGESLLSLLRCFFRWDLNPSWYADPPGPLRYIQSWIWKVSRHHSVMDVFLEFFCFLNDSPTRQKSATDTKPRSSPFYNHPHLLFLVILLKSSCSYFCLLLHFSEVILNVLFWVNVWTRWLRITLMLLDWLLWT